MSWREIVDLVLIFTMLLAIAWQVVRRARHPEVPALPRKHLLIPLMPVAVLLFNLVADANLIAKIGAGVFCVAVFAMAGKAFGLFRMEW